MQHIMRLNPLPFKMIASGEKTIELRLNDEKRRKLNRKDLITFVNTEDSIKTITAEVIDIYKYKSFKELYADLPLLKCGYTKEDISNAKPEDMIEYYSEEQQKKYGVLGIEIRVISLQNKGE
jgi:ASC-1-like (ASCH) protein